MAKGAEAKIKLINKIAKALGDSYLGEYDKKHYFIENENGEQIQIAISLTCPKNPIQFDKTIINSNEDWDFSDDANVKTIAPVASAAPAEITEEEKSNIANLLVKLGL